MSLERFISTFVLKNSGKTTLRHPEVRRQNESLLTNETMTVFEQVTNLRYDLISTVLSAVLNVAVIGLVVAPGVLIWYGLAGVLLALSSRMSQKRIQVVASNMQDRRKRLSGVLLRAWENIFSGNSTNLMVWNENFADRLQSLRQAAVRYDITRSIISGLTVSAALLLIAIGNAWYFAEHRTDIIGLSALLITLPRQLQTIQHIFSFFNVLISYKGVREQFEGIGRLFDLHDQVASALKYVKFKEIEIYVNRERKQFDTVEDFLRLIEHSPAMRITFRGANGVGKSTLLAYIAEYFTQDRVFIPSYTTEFEFPEEATAGLSDGRRAMTALTILGNEENRFILIDEWDANLDFSNVTLMDSQIDNWVARGRTVIETRHRTQ